MLTAYRDAGSQPQAFGDSDKYAHPWDNASGYADRDHSAPRGNPSDISVKYATGDPSALGDAYTHPRNPTHTDGYIPTSAN